MDRPGEDGGIVGQRPDDRVLVEEGERLLLGAAAAAEKLSEGLQPPAAV